MLIRILGESKKMSVSNKGVFLTNGHFLTHPVGLNGKEIENKYHELKMLFIIFCLLQMFLQKIYTRPPKFFLIKYRVFKKEGGKVKGYYTTKKLIQGAVWGFILTVRMGHLINCIKLPKNFTFKLKIRPSNI